MVFVSFSFTTSETKVGHIQDTVNILKDILRGALKAEDFGLTVAEDYELYKVMIAD